MVQLWSRPVDSGIRPGANYGILYVHMKSLRNIGIIITIIGAVLTFGIMVSTTSSIDSFSDLLFLAGFYVWVALPFAVLIVLILYIHRKGFSSASRAAILISSALVVMSSVLIYWASIFHSESSTSALVFIFIPIYALVAIAIMYGLSWLLLKAVMPGPKS
jgi:drug/metabolite transporter (DMT)-like permease